MAKIEGYLEGAILYLGAELAKTAKEIDDAKKAEDFDTEESARRKFQELDNQLRERVNENGPKTRTTTR